MKHFTLLLFLFILLFCFFLSYFLSAQPSPSQTAVLAELNLARTDPMGYALILADYALLLSGSTLHIPGSSPTRLPETLPAIAEAILFLRNQPALPPLALSPTLSLVTDAYLSEQASTGRIGHISANGLTFTQRIETRGSWKVSAGEALMYGADTPREAVIFLIVDAGVPSRNHRITIFTRSFRLVGISSGSHCVYGSALIMDFVGQYVPSPIAKR